LPDAQPDRKEIRRCDKAEAEHNLKALTTFLKHESISPWLKDVRSASLNEYRQLIEVYRNGGETALAQALAAESDSETIRARAVRKALLQLQRQNGITAVETQLNRAASLKLPE
jgi:hypothetical protein